jgi:hypothetical protein
MSGRESSFFAELKRRDVIRVAGLYLVAYENRWQRIRGSNPCTSLERAVS